MLRTVSVRAVAILAFCLSITAAQAQPTITPRGTDATLDVAAWNLEFFGEPTQGPPDDAQQANVQAVLQGAQIDVWALEEVVNGDRFDAVLAGIAGAGYAGVIGPSVSSSTVFNQRLAFVYNTAVVTPVGAPRAIFSGGNFGGRAPLELTADVTLGGTTRRMRFIAIHAKASSDAASYNTRLNGAAQLKTYVDGLLAQGIPVVVMGDFNDKLTGSISGGGRTSPYNNFVMDSAYTFATQRLSDQNVGTFCGSSTTCNSGSTIDHILLGGGATAGYVANSGDRYAQLLSNIPGYTTNTSDHLPVLAQFSLAAVADEDGPEAGALALLPAAPSPFRTTTTLRFSLAGASDVRIDVVDVLGRTVATVGGFYGAGEHRVALDGSGLAAGLYRVRLRAAGEERVQTIIRAR